jgi:hypothetical protein
MVGVPKQGKWYQDLFKNFFFFFKVQKDDGMGRFWVHLKKLKLIIENLEF